MKKRLLKDLPFGNLSAGNVLTQANGTYYIDRGESFYQSGGSSSNGWTEFDAKEKEIIDMIWGNEKWFEAATIEHVSMKVFSHKIELSFAPLDLGQAQEFAKGVRHAFINHYGTDGSYIWNKWKGFTVSLV